MFLLLLPLGCTLYVNFNFVIYCLTAVLRVCTGGALRTSYMGHNVREIRGE